MSSTITAASSTDNSHPIGFWFFFWGEFAERCSYYYGMRAILALYMTDRLGVDKADAGTFMSLFIAACYFFPLIGGWLADNYLGKYWTIVGFSIPYVCAQFMVGIENKYIYIAHVVGDGLGCHQAKYLDIDGDDVRSTAAGTRSATDQCVFLVLHGNQYRGSSFAVRDALASRQNGLPDGFHLSSRVNGDSARDLCFREKALCR